MKLILGTVQFGLDYGINNQKGKPNQESVNKILNTAFQNKINVLDTAEAYGNSQEVIGAYHSKSNHKFEIVTKFSSLRVDLPVKIIDRVKANIETLGVDSLYCYMFHNYSDFKTYFTDFKDDLRQLKSRGLIKKIGVSIYDNKELEDLLNYPEIEVVQLPFNLLDNINQRGSILKKAKDKGMEIHTRSAFLQGLFFRDIKSLPTKMNSLFPYLEMIQQNVKGSNINISDLALNYAVNQQNIDNVLIGVDSDLQLNQNIESLKIELPNQIVDNIDSIEVEDIKMLNPSNWN